MALTSQTSIYGLPSRCVLPRLGRAVALLLGRDAMGACGALDKGMRVPIRRASVCQVLHAGCIDTG